MCNLGEGILEFGIEKGIAQGIEQGIGRGRDKEREQIVLRMHSKGYTALQISDIVGIGLPEIEKIIK